MDTEQTSQTEPSSVAPQNGSDGARQPDLRNRLCVRLRNKVTGLLLCAKAPALQPPTPTYGQREDETENLVFLSKDDLGDASLWFFKPGQPTIGNMGEPIDSAKPVRIENLLTRRNLIIANQNVRYIKENTYTDTEAIADAGINGSSIGKDHWKIRTLKPSSLSASIEISLSDADNNKHLAPLSAGKRKADDNAETNLCIALESFDDSCWWIVEICEKIKVNPLTNFATLRIKGLREPIIFESSEAFCNWLSREADAIRKITNTDNSSQPSDMRDLMDKFRTHHCGRLSTYSNTIRTAVKDSDAATLNNTISSLEAEYETRKLLYSNLSPLSKVGEQIKKGDLGALFQVLICLNAEVRISLPLTLSQMTLVDALISKSIRKKNSDSDLKSDTLLIDAEQILKETAAYKYQSKANHETLSDTLATAIKQANDFQKETARIISDAEEEFRKTALVYQKFMALNASVQYWKRKAQFNASIAIGLIIFTISAAIWGFNKAEAAIIYVLSSHTTESSLSTTSGIAASSQSDLAPIQSQVGSVISNSSMPVAGIYVRYVCVILLITLMIWGLRILVQLFLSNLHQASDAYERVTMMKTYLALLNEKKIADNAESISNLILPVLFRPGASGLVKEDTSGPTTPIELLSRVAKTGEPSGGTK